MFEYEREREKKRQAACLLKSRSRSVREMNPYILFFSEAETFDRLPDTGPGKKKEEKGKWGREVRIDFRQLSRHLFHLSTLPLIFSTFFQHCHFFIAFDSI